MMSTLLFEPIYTSSTLDRILPQHLTPTTSLSIYGSYHGVWRSLPKKSTKRKSRYVHREEGIDFRAVERCIQKFIGALFMTYSSQSKDYTLIMDMTGLLTAHVGIDLPCSINELLGTRIRDAFRSMGIQANVKPKTKARLKALIGVNKDRLEKSVAKVFGHAE